MKESDITRLAAIAERANTARPGPWECYTAEHTMHHIPDVRFNAPGLGKLNVLPHADNAEFIAHAREDVPWLLATLRESQAECERLRGADAMLRAIEQIIPRNDAHRDYAETVELFVHELKTAASIAYWRTSIHRAVRHD